MSQRRARFLALAVERQFRRRLRTGIHRVLVTGIDHLHAQPLVELLAQLVRRQVEFGRRQHRAFDVVRALVVAFGSLRPELVGRFAGAFAEHEQGVVGEVVEQRGGLSEK